MVEKFAQSGHPNEVSLPRINLVLSLQGLDGERQESGRRANSDSGDEHVAHVDHVLERVWTGEENWKKRLTFVINGIEEGCVGVGVEVGVR